MLDGAQTQGLSALCLPESHQGSPGPHTTPLWSPAAQELWASGGTGQNHRAFQVLVTPQIRLFSAPSPMRGCFSSPWPLSSLQRRLCEESLMLPNLPHLSLSPSSTPPHHPGCHTPIIPDVTLPLPCTATLPSDVTLPLPFIVTPPLPRLSNSHYLHCHTPIAPAVTLPASTSH